MSWVKDLQDMFSKEKNIERLKREVRDRAWTDVRLERTTRMKLEATFADPTDSPRVLLGKQLARRLQAMDPRIIDLRDQARITAADLANLHNLLAAGELEQAVRHMRTMFPKSEPMPTWATIIFDAITAPGMHSRKIDRLKHDDFLDSMAMYHNGGPKEENIFDDPPPTFLKDLKDL
jgi:hypothetical protein